MDTTTSGGLEEAEAVAIAEVGANQQEPYEGKQFESDEAAKTFYNEYARRVGFLTRVLSSRRSERDGSVTSRGLGCRGGGCNNCAKGQAQQRESCSAMVLLKKEKQGRWFVRKFVIVREHNHPLAAQLPKSRWKFDEKDKKFKS